MKAVTYDQRNSPDVLVVGNVEKPVPTDDQVLVKIYAVSVNAADYRSMKLGIIPKRKIFGADIAGRIEAVGKNVKKFRIGDEVWGRFIAGFESFAFRNIYVGRRQKDAVSCSQTKCSGFGIYH